MIHIYIYTCLGREEVKEKLWFKLSRGVTDFPQEWLKSPTWYITLTVLTQRSQIDTSVHVVEPEDPEP